MIELLNIPVINDIMKRIKKSFLINLIYLMIFKRAPMRTSRMISVNEALVKN